jgi:hypothetical protein
VNKHEKEKLEAAREKVKEVNDTRNADRLAALEAIADNADGERPEVEEPQDEPQEQEADSPQEEQEKQQEPEEDSDTKLVNGETFYRMIVNGQEKWQNLKQIREAAQKVESADEYLAKAKESVNNSPRVAPSKDEQLSLEEDQIADLHRKAAMGEEDAIKALASWQAGLARQLREAPKQIDQRLSFRTELAQLESEYSDVLKDPDAGDLFRARLARLKVEAPNTTLSDAYKQIGEPIRNRFKTTGKLQEKLERKRALPIPVRASARQATTEVEEESQDDGKSIEEMARARGKSAYVHPGRQ